MADYNLGTAKGKVQVDYDGKGLDQARRDMDKTGKSAKGSGQNFNEAGHQMAVAGGVIAVGIGLAAKVAIDFEKQISAIGAVSGASSEDLERLRKKALQLGADTSFGAGEAANAMEELAKAGLTVDQILGGAADATVALAAAGGVELPAAAELAADAMNAFSLSASDLPKVADQIAGAANASSISVGDFGQSLKQVGAVANLVGLSFEDTATAIALMGQAGIKGSDAGTSLKTMLSNLSPTTKKQIELFKELGLVTKDGSNQFFDAKGNIKSLADISQLLQDRTKNMTAEQKQLTLETIFGSDAIRAAAVLTKAGSKGFEEMATAMGKVTAEEVAAKRLDNTAGAIEQLKGSAETAAIAFGTLLLPAITKIVKALTKFANFLNSMDDGTKSLILNIAMVTAGFLLFLGVAVKVMQFVRAVKALVVAMKLLRIVTVAWTVAIKVLALAWRLFNAVFLTSPIGLVVLAIILLVAAIILLWKRSETFRNIVLAVWAAIKKAAQAVASWFMNTLVPFFKNIWGSISGFFEAAWKVIKVIFNAWLTVARTWFNVLKTIFSVVAPIWKAAFDLIVSVVKTAFAIMDALFAVWITLMRTIWEPILRFVAFLFEHWWNAIKMVVTAVINFLRPFIEGWLNAQKAIWGAIWSGVSKATTAAFNAIKKAIEIVVNFLKPFIVAWLNFQKAVFTTAWNAIKAIVTTVFNAIKLIFTTTWNAIAAIVRTAVNTIVAIINGIKAIVDKVRGFFNELKRAAEGGTGSLISFVKGIPGRVIGAIGNLGGMLYNKGRELIQGFINGIRSMLGVVADTARNIVNSVTRFLPGSPAKEGPLSGRGYVKYRGQHMVEDFASGIIGTAKAARDAVARTLGGVSKAVPMPAGAAVGQANAGMAAHVERPPAPAAPSGGDRTITIGTVSITGTWDLDDPEVPRKFVAKLHEELDRYAKGYK